MFKNTKMMGLAAACMLLSVTTSQAAVTLSFAQVGPDVTATWSGTYELLPGGSGSSNTVGRAETGSSYLYGFGAPNSWLWSPNAGVATPTGLVATNDGSYVGDSFGFFNSLFFWHDGTPGTTYEPVGMFTFPNRTLADLGADSFNNTLAYTGNNNIGESAKIYYNTIPEPTSALLCSLGALTLVARRRRNA